MQLIRHDHNHGSKMQCVFKVMKAPVLRLWKLIKVSYEIGFVLLLSDVHMVEFRSKFRKEFEWYRLHMCNPVMTYDISFSDLLRWLLKNRSKVTRNEYRSSDAHNIFSTTMQVPVRVKYSREYACMGGRCHRKQLRRYSVSLKASLSLTIVRKKRNAARWTSSGYCL